MNIGFFVTCLVDLMRPKVGFAAIDLIEKAGSRVTVPEKQSCCGQPAWNSGDAASARRIAKQVINTFATVDYVVVPSGSCAGMIVAHYPELFESDLKWQQRARDLAERTYELTRFLQEVLKLNLEEQGGQYRVAYHDSCSGLRELNVHDQPRALLRQLGNTEVREIRDGDVCCGFGGTFCAKYPQISSKIVKDKVANVKATHADVLLGGDLGCLLNIAGSMRRNGEMMRVMHVAEWLNGRFDEPGIADPDSDKP